MNDSIRPVADLRPHPENATIFGDPGDSHEYALIKASIKAHGIWEPLVILDNGTVLSGHLRLRIAEELQLKKVPVRVVPAFANYRAEVEYLIRLNTDRRSLTKGQIASAFKRLRELPKADGGAKRKMGRPAADEGKSAASSLLNAGASTRQSRDDAAEILGVGRNEAMALEKVFYTPGVPDELKAAVNSGAVAPTPAAKAVVTELKRQGGEIVDPAALKAAAIPQKPMQPIVEETHESRVAAEAHAFERDFRELFETYKRLDSILRRRPLKSVIGPTEHHQYRQMVRDISLRAWREIEGVEGETNLGKQMSLTVLDGGRS